MLNKNLLGKSLKEIRKSKGLTQAQAAELIGIARSTYTRYETGSQVCPDTMLIKISQAFEIPVEDLAKHIMKDIEDNPVEAYNLKDIEALQALEEVTGAYEIALALTQKKEDSKNDCLSVQWASKGVEAAKEINEAGLLLISQFIDCVKTNPAYKRV